MYRKYTPEEKIQIVEGYVNGEYSWKEKAYELTKMIQGVFVDGSKYIKNMDP